jgi:hypothetical protein
LSFIRRLHPVKAASKDDLKRSPLLMKVWLALRNGLLMPQLAQALGLICSGKIDELDELAYCWLEDVFNKNLTTRVTSDLGLAIAS